MVEKLRQATRSKISWVTYVLLASVVLVGGFCVYQHDANAAISSATKNSLRFGLASGTAANELCTALDLSDQFTESAAAWAMTGNTGAAATVGQSVTTQGGVGGTTSGIGGAAQVIGGAGTGSGVGGAAVVTGGAGGATATGGAVNITAGATIDGATGTGGAVVIAGGANANTTNGAGGAVTIDGGLGKGNLAGGAVSIDGGIAGATGSGGVVNLTGGASAAGATGAGGAVTVAGGVSGSTDGAGGAANINGGGGTGTGNGGAVNITAGTTTGGATGTGGDVVIAGGVNANTTNGAGGLASVTGGAGKGTGAGGAASLVGGAVTGSGTGGAVNLDGGLSSAGTEGAITIGTTNAEAVTIGRSGKDVTVGGVIKTSVGNGTIVTDKCTAVEAGDGVLHQTTVTFTLTGAHDLDMADADHGTGIKVYDFPAGSIQILGATCNAIATSVNTGAGGATYPMALGSAVGADDNTLTSTEADIIPSTAIAGGTGSTASDFHATLAAPILFANAAGNDLDLYCNAAITAAVAEGAVTIAVTGTATITWINLGDY